MAKTLKSLTAQAATANRLHDGVVVYRAADGSWSTRIEESEVARDAEAAKRLLVAAENDAAERLVVGPYLFAVTEEDGVKPVGVRETIRALGPSVETKVA
jgi:hypothetical protein